MATSQVFILSPARLDGKRGQILLNPAAAFPLARELRSRRGAAIGEVFSFLSGLYFRGKLAYATAFARPPRSAPGTGVLVITATRGLVPPTLRIRREDLIEFAGIDLATADARFREPLARDVRSLARRITRRTQVVLLGSIATGKYVDPLLEVFGARLCFPSDFVGRGDMSRGGLLLRCVSGGAELPCIPVAGAVRKGARPPRLAPLRRGASPGQFRAQ